MATDKKSISTKDFTLTTEWIYYLGFLFTLALLYIYLTHRTDNIVRDLVELRAENITLKSDIMKNRSRANLESRLSNRGVKEPNRAVKVIRIKND